MYPVWVEPPLVGHRKYLAPRGSDVKAKILKQPEEHLQSQVSCSYMKLITDSLKRGKSSNTVNPLTPGGGLPYETDGDARRKF